MKFTRGPWKVDPLGIGTPWNVGTEDDNVALAMQLVGDSMRQERRAANAALIAKAPEMFDAIRAYLAAFDRDAVIALDIQALRRSIEGIE